jgi:hypothetical protein
MPRVTLVRYATKPDRAEENEALSRAVFAELRRTRPKDVAYGLFRDGAEFVHVFMNLAEDSSNPVTELPSFKAFQAEMGERCEVPPTAVRLAATLVDSYGLTEAPVPA